MPAFVSRYATAFADVVTSSGLNTPAIDTQLNDFVATWSDSAELRAFLVNPAIPASQKVSILDQLNTRLGMQKELRNLTAILIKNDRVSHVVEVAEAYRRILQERSGIQPAEIVTSRELGPEERNILVAQVGRVAGSKIDPRFKLDASILGGTVVRIGSTVYDGSVKGRLERLKETLTAD
jgi:F-type H+-transporting ATPase subunit delta